MGFERHVADFVEIERAAMGLFEHADLAAAALDAVFGAEQFEFELIGRHHRAIDDDERFLGAARLAMQGARNDFLARARRAGNQDAAAGRRYAFDDLAHLIDGRGFADDFVIGPGAEFQFLIFALEPRRVERMLDLQNQPVGLEWFFDEIISAHLDGRHRRIDIAVAADHDDGHVGNSRRICCKICMPSMVLPRARYRG